MLGFALLGCAAWKPAARTVNDLARDACVLYFGPQMAGLSIEDVARTACSTRKQIDPFLREILAGQQRAGMQLAGVSQPAATPSCPETPQPAPASMTPSPSAPPAAGGSPGVAPE